jgi:signal peptidase I
MWAQIIGGAIVVWALSYWATKRAAAATNEGDAAESSQPAGAAIRLAAKLSDSLAISPLQLLIIALVALLDAVGVISGRLTLAGLLLSALVFVSYFTVLTARSGQSWGKRLAGVSVERSTGGRLGWGRSLVRALSDFIMLVLWLVLLGVIDAVWIVLNRRKRALHDVVAGSWVRRVGAPSRVLPWLATLGWLAPTVLVFGIIRPLVVQAYSIPPNSTAMSPSVNGGDHLLVNKLAYRLRSIQRGDIVVFKAPPSALAGGDPSVVFVKRVVAIPGDRVEIKRRDGIYVNRVKRRFGAMSVPEYDWPVDEFGMPAGMPYVVPTGTYFVLGDNSNTSNDSHRWMDPETGEPRPELPGGLILGKVTLCYWPPARVAKAQ